MSCLDFSVSVIKSPFQSPEFFSNFFLICVAMMALLTDHGYHHLIIPISALLAQALGSCALAGEDTVLPALLSHRFLVHLPWQSLTMLRKSPLKTSFCSSGPVGSYSPIFQEIAWIFWSRAQAMWGTSGSYKLQQLESMPVMRFDIKSLLGLPKYTYI